MNPQSMGMTAALDARFITGTANNATISTWPNRANASNDATQPTSNARPQYVETVINGQPVVRFATKELYTSSSIFSGTGPKLLMCAYKANGSGSFINPIAGQSVNATAGSWFVLHSRNLFGASGDPYIAGYAQDTASGVTSPDQQWKIAGGYFDSGSLYTRKNGATVDTRTGYTLNTVNTTLAIGVDAEGYYLNGDIAAIVGGGVAIGFPALKRLEAALAFSFKISIN